MSNNKASSQTPCKVSITLKKDNALSTCTSESKIEIVIVEPKTNSSQIFEMTIATDIKNPFNRETKVVTKSNRTSFDETTSTTQASCRLETDVSETETIKPVEKKKKKKSEFFYKIKNQLKKALGSLVPTKIYVYIKAILSQMIETFVAMFHQL